MKLVYYRGDVPNFGDELNLWMWERLLPPGFLDDDPSELFVGIGSILSGDLPAAARKHVLGSGFGGYNKLPDVHDGSWNVVFVRGPATAAALGLPPEAAISDAAVLLRLIDLPEPVPAYDVGYMPHFHSFARGDWAQACARAGVRLIDPRAEVETVLAEIRGAHLVVTEAMHGAIVADALRVPWVAVEPIHGTNREKWRDWSDTVGVDLRQHRLAPTTVFEAYLQATATKYYHGPRAYRWNESATARPVNALLTRRAGARLAALAREAPQLSDDAAIARVTDRAAEALQGFLARR